MTNPTPKYQPSFEVGKVYHIYNRANNQDLLFYQEKNYSFFLDKYDKYLSNYLNTFAYCLIPNHFHFMIQVKDLDDLSPNDLNKKISEQFRRLFITYSQAINKQENRKGSLFQKPFKRKVIENSNYFTQLILYIHFNPVNHNYVNNLQDYKWSSYHSIPSSTATKICRKNVLKWFGGKKKFIDYHKNYTTQKINQKLIIEP